MTTCQQIVEFLSAYLEEDLDAVTIQHFDQHMADCPPCVYYVQTFRQMIVATGQIPSIETITIPVELKERLHRFLNDKIPNRGL
jgi:anti-sigma factor RsiW